VKVGASPRAVQALIRAARVRALAEGRAHVAFEDIRHFAPKSWATACYSITTAWQENLRVPGPGRRNRPNRPEDSGCLEYREGSRPA
jgi:hypothetical protein